MMFELMRLIFAAIFGWALHEIVISYYQRKTVRAYLLIVIPSLIKDYRVSVNEMEIFFTHRVSVGKIIGIAPIHRNESLDLLACMKVEAIKCLSKEEVKKFTHFYIALYHIDGLLKGFSEHLVKHENKVIEQRIWEHLHSHIERSRKIVEQFPDDSDFSSINDLPKHFHFLNML